MEFSGRAQGVRGNPPRKKKAKKKAKRKPAKRAKRKTQYDREREAHAREFDRKLAAFAKKERAAAARVARIRQQLTPDERQMLFGGEPFLPSFGMTGSDWIREDVELEMNDILHPSWRWRYSEITGQEWDAQRWLAALEGLKRHKLVKKDRRPKAIYGDREAYKLNDLGLFVWRRGKAGLTIGDTYYPESQPDPSKAKGLVSMASDHFLSSFGIVTNVLHSVEWRGEGAFGDLELRIGVNEYRLLKGSYSYSRRQGMAWKKKLDPWVGQRVEAIAIYRDYMGLTIPGIKYIKLAGEQRSNPMQTSARRANPRFVLRKDRDIKGVYGSYNDALAALQNMQPNSWEHAFNYEGWTIDEEGPEIEVDFETAGAPLKTFRGGPLLVARWQTRGGARRIDLVQLPDMTYVAKAFYGDEQRSASNFGNWDLARVLEHLRIQIENAAAIDQIHYEQVPVRRNNPPRRDNKKRRRPGRERQSIKGGGVPMGYIEGAPPVLPGWFLILMSAGKSGPLTVSYGQTLGEVSKIQQAWIQHYNVGSAAYYADTPGWVQDDVGNFVAKVSYNGRVWEATGPKDESEVEITGTRLALSPSEFRKRKNPVQTSARRSNPGLAILNPLPDHLQAFVERQQLTPPEREEFNVALAKYCEFHGVSADEVNITELPDTVLPDVMAGAGGNRFLVAMGDTEDTSYSANTKHDYINSNKRGVPFKHEYPSKPTMATDPSGQMIFIINKPGQDKHFVVKDWIRG